MADTNTSIALITKYSTEGFDDFYKTDAICSILKKDSTFVKFVSAKTVKVAKMAFGGLSNYTTNNEGDGRREFAEQPGYKGTQASLVWEERTIRMDRAAKYAIEKFDDEESGGMLVGNALTLINKHHIVPEIDAYCFSEIFKNAGHVETGQKQITRGGTAIYAPLSALNDGIVWQQKHEVPDSNIIIFTSVDFLNALRNTEELTKFMQQGDYSKDVSFTLTSYEGKKLVAVPPARFKTEWSFGDYGYYETANSKDIDFIVMPIDSAVHVVKFQKTRILEGDVATAMTNMDGYVLLARIYHDLFVLDNKKVAIYAHTDWFSSSLTDEVVKKKETTAGYTKPQVGIYTKDNVADDIIVVPGDVYGKVWAVAEATTVTLGTSKIGDSGLTLSDLTLTKVGDTIATATYKYYYTDARGVFVAEATVVAK